MAIKNIGLGGSDYWVDGDVLLGSDLKDTFNKTECVDNLTQDIDSGSTVDEYPSAKAVYDKYKQVASVTHTTGSTMDVTVPALALGETYVIDYDIGVNDGGQKYYFLELLSSSTTYTAASNQVHQSGTSVAGQYQASNGVIGFGDTNQSSSGTITITRTRNSYYIYNFQSYNTGNFRHSGGGRFANSFTLETIRMRGEGNNTILTGCFINVYKRS